MIATPIPATWANGAVLIAEDLNTQVRDVMRFLTTSGHCSVHLASNQTMPAARTNIVWDTTTDDSDNLITTPGATFTFTREGVIALRCVAAFGINTTGTYRRIILTLNGADYTSASLCVGANNPVLALATELPVSIGDTCTLVANHDATASVAMTGGQTSASLTWVGTTSLALPAPSLPPTGQNPTKHVTNFDATFSRTYDSDNTTSNDDTKYCYQGYYDSDRGNNRSLVGFDSATMVTTLINAQRVSMRLRFHVAKIDTRSVTGMGDLRLGGATAVIGAHNYLTKPSNWTGSNVDENLKRVLVRPDTTYWVTLPPSIVARLQSGGYRGIAFGPGPNKGNGYFCTINGATMASPPRLEVTYWS